MSNFTKNDLEQNQKSRSYGFNNKNKEISRSGLLLPVEYLRNGKRYSSFVFTVTNGKSHATKRCNPRLCCCYRFWDIAVANIKIFDFDVKFARANSYMPASSHGIIMEIWPERRTRKLHQINKQTEMHDDWTQPDYPTNDRTIESWCWALYKPSDVI